MLIGYARVSTTMQDYEKQIHALLKYGVDERHIFKEKMSGRKNRPIFNEMKDFLKDGDTLVVQKINRLGRLSNELVNLYHFFQQKNVNFVSIQENLDFSSSMGKMYYYICSILAQNDSDQISEDVKSYIKYAKEKGIYKTKPPLLSQVQVTDLKEKIEKGWSKKDTASFFGVTRQTIYNYLKY